MKFQNLRIVWTEEKNLSLPDLLNRSLTTTTQDKHRLRTVEIPHNQNTQPIQCPYAVSKEYINTKITSIIVESPHFPIYLQLKENYFKVQLENDLYFPVSYHVFKNKAQIYKFKNNYNKTKNNNLNKTTHC